MPRPTIWETLGVAATRDEVEIRRAYARKLKVTDAEENVEAFQLLRAAYETALKLARQPQLTTVAAPGAAPARVAAPAPIASGNHGNTEANNDAAVATIRRAAAAAPAAAAANDVAAMRAALDALHFALLPTAKVDEVQLKQLLEGVIEIAARGSLALQHDAENMLAQIIVATSPRSDALLDQCILQFNWVKRAAARARPPRLDWETDRSRAGAVGCLWAIYVSGPMASISQNRTLLLSNSHVATAVMMNAALAPWWLFSTLEFVWPPRDAPSFGTSSVGAFALMCASAFAVRPLGQAWTERLTDIQRKHCRTVLAVCAVIVAAVDWFAAENVSFRPAVAWLVVTFVVIHRIACVDFNVAQLKTRIFVPVGGVIAAFLLIGAGITRAAPITQMGGLVLCAGSLVDLGMAYYNQRQRDLYRKP